MIRHTKDAGFTLIEVLVATAVIAIALAAIIRSTGLNVANAAYLRDKTFAHWVAMNQMADLQIKRTYPPIGKKSGREEMAGRDWFWTREVKQSPDKDIRRVEIRVRMEEKKDGPALTELTGFFTRFGSAPGDKSALGDK